MSEGLTSDEPYEPSDPEIAKIAGALRHRTTKERIEESPPWRQPKVHEAGTQLARDTAFEEKLAEIERKMDAGQPLSEADADYAMNRATLRLFRSRRPSMVAKAVSLMQNGRIKKILDVGDKSGGSSLPPPGGGLGLGNWGS